MLILRCPLPGAVGVTYQLLETSWVTKFLGLPAKIHFPRLLDSEPILIQPNVLVGVHTEPQYSDGTDPDDARPTSPWGWPTEWEESPEDSSFAVAQLVVTLQGVGRAQSNEIYEGALRAFRHWFRVLKDWIEVWTGQDLDDVAPRKRVEVLAQGWDAWYRGTTFRPPSTIRVDFDYGTAMTPELWMKALGLAASSSEPPAESLLLRDARAAHARSQYRRSVIDAGTALEIALYALLAAANRSQSPLADELLESAKRWTLGTLLLTCKRVCDVPSTVTHELVQLRNEVIHKTARKPTKVESSAMLSAATDAVNAAS